jgi:hypothetical protein
MTTENELRQALTAEAETMKWSLSMHDVVTAEVVDNVMSLDTARRRRTPLMLTAAAAVVGLIGGGSYLATHRSNNEGRVLAGGPAAGKVAASNAASSSARFGPTGPVSLAGMTLVLPKDPPATYRLQNVSVMPVGSSTGSSSPGYRARLQILKSASSSERISVNATSLGGDSPVFSTVVPGYGQTLKIHGVDAQLYNGGSAKDLNWIERGVQYVLGAPLSLPDADAVKLAESLVPAAEGSVAFSLPAPSGYAVAYDGDGNMQSPWSFSMQYSRENLDKPTDDSISIDVQPSDGGPLDTLRLLGYGTGPSKTVRVGGVDGTLETNDGVMIVAESGVKETSDQSSSSMLLTWKSGDGLIIGLNSQGLSEAELVAFAESIATVDEARFRAAVGDRLQSNGGYIGPDFSVPGVITFTGTTDGRAWTLKATPPGPADSPNANCTQFGFDGTGSFGSGCGSGPTNDSFTEWSASTENGITYAFGVVSQIVRKVVVRDADSGKDLASVDTVVGTGDDDRRAYVVALKPLEKDVKNFMLVGLNEKGEVVATPTPKPAVEYPGNFSQEGTFTQVALDPAASAAPPVPAKQASPSTTFASSVPEAADPTKLPVFATGMLDGRPWELRKPDGLTPAGPTCWYLSFAAGGLQFSCGGNVELEMNLVVVHDRRNFVLANTADDVTKVKATFKDGRVEEVVPTVKGTDRVAVIGVGLNDVLVSVTAVDAKGKETTTVTGTLPGDPSLPFNFADATSDGGWFAYAPATTVAAAATTIKP